MEPLLTPRQLAEVLGLSVQTLYNRRSNGASMPPAILIGNKVRYRPRDVERWLQSLQSGPPADLHEHRPEPTRGPGRPTKAQQVRMRQQAAGASSQASPA
jgi:predicted DNA-binding transcriptional regulator AlpA